MRILFFSGLLLAVLNGGAFAAADGWYLVPVAAHSNTPAGWLPLQEIGTGAAAGMVGLKAVYFKKNLRNNTTLQRDVPLRRWQGKRVRVSLRLRNEGEARAWTSMFVANTDTNGVRTSKKFSEADGENWQTQQFVLDVPANGSDLIVNVGIQGQGKIWVDDLRLEAVTAAVPVDYSRRVINTAGRCGPECVGN